jgi:hypothetical protein
MGKAGGIIGLIAGIFAVIAALATLAVGGFGSAFEAKGAEAIVNFGWLGLVAAFLVIVAGAVSIFNPGVGAFGLLFLSLVGAILGGTFVAICFALALLGGVVAAFGAKNMHTQKRQLWPWGGLVLGVIVSIALAVNMAEGSATATAVAASPATDAVQHGAEPATEPTSNTAPTPPAALDATARVEPSAATANQTSDGSNEVAGQPAAPMADAQFAKSFVCPESLPDDDARTVETRRFVEWSAAHHPDWKLSKVVAYRVSLLEANGCEQTLRSIREASAG